MKETFVQKRFSTKHEEIIAAAEKILLDYREQGFNLTLRQLYYQFVATQPLNDPFENTQKSYKRLGVIISNARLAGRLDWSDMVDRTRSIKEHNSWDSPIAIISACADQYQRDVWTTQPSYVEAWVEKDALVGVLEAACAGLRIPYFSCRGYTSQSSLYAAGKRVAIKGRNRDVVILHLGDHDPSGMDMTRDIRSRISMFSGRQVDVRRIALNMDQVEEENPPPNPAKMTDSRAAGYVGMYGYNSWELDALSPTYIRELINDEVDEVVDHEAWDMEMAREATERNQIRNVCDHWDQVVEFVRNAQED